MHCSKVAFVLSVSLTVGNGQRTKAIYHSVVEIDLSKMVYELCASFRSKMTEEANAPRSFREICGINRMAFQ